MKNPSCSPWRRRGNRRAAPLYDPGAELNWRTQLKKLSNAARLRLRRHAERSFARSHRQNRSARPVAEIGKPSKTINLYRRGETRRALRGQTFDVPAILSLTENYDETAGLIMDIRETMRRNWLKNQEARLTRAQRRRLEAAPAVINYWDFSKIKKITSDVALLIAAEFDNIVKNSGWLPSAIEIDKWDPNVLKILDGIGFLELVKIERPRSAFLSGTGWKMLRFRAGREADGRSVDDLLGELGLAEVIDDPRLYDAVAEAITNTVHHAYPTHAVFEEPHIPEWWMTGFVIPEQRRVSISVLDHGLTIPGTLPSWDRYPRYHRGFRRLLGRDPDPNDVSYDGTAIALAMAVGRSSTSQSYRGQGLPLIEATVDHCRAGSLRVYSRQGTYERVTGQRPRSINRSLGIKGTLITWDWAFSA